jgi:hypothetical protein
VDQDLSAKRMEHAKSAQTISLSAHLESLREHASKLHVKTESSKRTVHAKFASSVSN